jgi:hypothetical protein
MAVEGEIANVVHLNVDQGRLLGPADNACLEITSHDVWEQGKDVEADHGHLSPETEL